MRMFGEAGLSFLMSVFLAVFAYNILLFSDVGISIIWDLFLLTVPSLFRVQCMEFQYHYNAKHYYKIIWVQCAIAGMKKKIKQTHEEMYKCKLSQMGYLEYYRRKINNKEPSTE